jgi:O-antigen/teichoic acid export membrane protein
MATIEMPAMTNTSHPAGDLSTADYNRRAKDGIKLMFARQALIQVLTFAGGIVLTRTLTPEIFGVFGISMCFVNALALFGDFGLAPSLVQRKNDLDERDLQVAFTMQQALLTLVAVGVWFGAPYFLLMYPDIGGSEITWLIRTMAVSLFLQSWRSMSILQMERHLDFKKVAWIEVIEALSFQGLAVGLALVGFGVWSLVWATLARGVLGTLFAYIVSPWRVRIVWDAAKASEILRFGLPFQAGQILNSTEGWLTPLLVGTLIGPAGVGLLTWAAALGRKPLLLMGALTRVAFPHFSRMQHDEGALVHAYERYLYPLLALAGMWLTIILVGAADLVPLIYTEKWVPAIPALYLFAVVMALNMIGWMTGTLLRSMGHVAYNVNVAAASSLLTIVVAVPLVYRLGIMAIPVAMLLAVTFKLFAFLRKTPKGCATIAVSGLARINAIVFASALAGWCVQSVLPPGLARVGVALSVASLVYVAFATVCLPDWIRERTVQVIRNRLPWNPFHGILNRQGIRP